MSQPRRKRRSPKTSIWPLLLVLGGIGVLGLTLFFATRGPTAPANFTPAVTGSPKLQADRQAVNLGDVRLGQTVEVAFEIANLGDKPLRFTEAPYVEVVEGC